MKTRIFPYSITVFLLIVLVVAYSHSSVSPLFPWLMAGGGVLIGLVLGALTGPAVMGGSLFPPAPRPDPASTGAEKQVFGDDESTLFIKLPVESLGSLGSFDPHLSTANQLTKVEVLGYDDTHKKEIAGSATTGDVSGSHGTSSHQKGADGSDSEHSKHNHDAIIDVEAEMYVDEIHLKKWDE